MTCTRFVDIGYTQCVAKLRSEGNFPTRLDLTTPAGQSTPWVNQVTQPVVVTGVGLHSGAPARVVLEARPGPVRLVTRDGEATLEQLTVAATARATTVESHDARVRIGTVEHAFSALAGLGIHAGVTLTVEGPEMPLLDGGAGAWCEALAKLELPSTRPGLRVTRAAGQQNKLCRRGHGESQNPFAIG